MAIKVFLNWWVLCMVSFHLTSAQSAGTIGQIEVDGPVLDYVVEGGGTSCLVIGSSIYYPKTISKNLRQHFRFYFIDMKWFAKGYAPEALDTVTIQSIVEDVEAIRKKLGLRNPILLGHSIHGTIALEYAKKYGQHLSGLIAIGSPCLWGNDQFNRRATSLWETASKKRKAIQTRNWGNITELDRLTGKEEAVAAYNRSAPQYWYDPYYDASWLWDGMTVHSELTQHLFTKVFADYDMFKSNESINLPVFVGLGKYDYVIPHTMWKSKYSQIPDFTKVLFKKSGHTPQLEESDQFDTVLINWWKEKNR